MKNLSLVIIGAVLASTLSAAFAAPRHQVRAADTSPNAVYSNHFDSEQARRDIGGQGG